jgi:hypothetical protein
MAASRGVTSLRPLRPVGRRSSGRVVVVDRRCAASRRALGGWARRRCRSDRPLRQATVRREARPSCPRADRSPGDDGWVAHLLAAVHPAHAPIPRCERASDGLVRSPRSRPWPHSGPRPPVRQALRAAFASRAGQRFGRSPQPRGAARSLGHGHRVPSSAPQQRPNELANGRGEERLRRRHGEPSHDTTAGLIRGRFDAAAERFHHVAIVDPAP